MIVRYQCVPIYSHVYICPLCQMDQICRNREIAVAEFFFYATVLMAAATALWIWLRRYHFPWWLLTIIEFGILIQFAGGLIPFGGARLYDHVFFYIRFD